MLRRSLFAVVCLALPASALAEPPDRLRVGQGQGNQDRGNQDRGGQDRGRGGNGGRGASGGAFSDPERFVIADWYRSNPTRAEGLPPGIARNLERGKPLPPGIARRALPAGLEGRLPPRDGRYARVVVGRDVLLIEVGTGLVLDILRGVLG